MDKDLKKLITEMVDNFFKDAPVKPVEKGVRPQYFDMNILRMVVRHGDIRTVRD